MRRVHCTHRVARRTAGRRDERTIRAATSSAGSSFAAEKQAVTAQQEANERRAAELEATARKQQQEMAKAEDGVQRRLVTERKTIAEQESARARQQVEDELRAERKAVGLQTKRIRALAQKLATAQAAQADLLKKEQLLEDRA